MHMLATACKKRLNLGSTFIADLLRAPGSWSVSTSTQLQQLVFSLIPPINDYELYGYRRPNINYQKGMPVDAASPAAAAADAARLNQFGANGFNFYIAGELLITVVQSITGVLRSFHVLLFKQDVCQSPKDTSTYTFGRSSYRYVHAQV